MLEKGSDHPNGVSRPKGDEKSSNLPHTVPNWEERLEAARAQRERALMARHLDSKRDSAPAENPKEVIAAMAPGEAESATPEEAPAPAETEGTAPHDLFTAVTDRLGRSLVVAMACFASLGFGLAVGIGALFGVGSMRASPPTEPESETVAQPAEATAPMYADPPPVVVAALPEPDPTVDPVAEPTPVPALASEAEGEATSEPDPRPTPEDVADAATAPGTPPAVPAPLPEKRADAEPTPAAGTAPTAEAVTLIEAAMPAAPPQPPVVTEQTPNAPLPETAAEAVTQPDPPVAGALSLVAWLPLQPVPAIDAHAGAAASAISPPDPLPGTEWTLAEKLRAGGADLSTLDLRVYAPDAVSTPRHETNMNKLAGTGLAVEAVQRVDFTVSAAHIRYYNSEDSSTAEALAEELDIEARDFTDKRNGPAGLIEVWFAGAAKGKLSEELSTRRNGRYLFDRLRDKLRSD